LQDGLVGVATALSPALPGHFKFLFHQLFVGLGLALDGLDVGWFTVNPLTNVSCCCKIPPERVPQLPHTTNKPVRETGKL
jgi:hypothetical protein